MTVGVHPLAGFDKLLHYKVPETLRAQVAVGSLVRVPILNRQLLGIVGEIGEPKDFPVDRLKSVAAVVYPFPALPPDLLGRANASFQVVTGTLLPAGALVAGPMATAVGLSATMWVSALGGLLAVPVLWLAMRSTHARARRSASSKPGG